MDALDSILSPAKGTIGLITHNLPEPIRDFGLSLIGAKCYSTLLLNLDFSASNSECLSLAISKALGIAIVSASAIVKLPQIINLVKSQSAEGLSFLSYFLETTSFIITLAYNVRNGFPFSTYGETAFIAVQNVGISVLILTFSGKAPAAAAFVAALAAALYALLGPDNVVDSNALGYLQAGAGILGVASKIPQILTIWQSGTTGQLSAFTVFNYLVGSVTRIFTTLKEVDDRLILYGFVAGFLLNAILTAQVVYYWNAPTNSAVKTKARVDQLAGASSSATTTLANHKGPSTRRRG